MNVRLQLKSQFDPIMMDNVIGYDIEAYFVLITQRVNETTIYRRYAKLNVLSLEVEITKEE